MDEKDRPNDPAARPINTDASSASGPIVAGSGRRFAKTSIPPGAMRVNSRHDANQPVPDTTLVPGDKADNRSADRRADKASVEARLEDIQAAEELHLRRPAALERVLERLPDENPVRQLLVAIADSFFSQLVIGLVATVLLVLGLHGLDPAARFAGPLLYLYFLGAALHFSRFRPHHALLAAVGLSLTGFLLFTVSTGSGANMKPLLAFKPTALFWLSICLVNGVATALQNRHVADLLERRVALLALQRQIREKEERAGKAGRADKVEETFNLAKKAEGDKQKVVIAYSSIFTNMQRLSRNLSSQELFECIWDILKQTIGATEGQIYGVREGRLEAVAQFAKREPKAEQQAFLEAAPPNPEVLAPAEWQSPTISLAPDQPSLFQFSVQYKRNLFFEDIGRDRLLEQLSAKNPVPVAYCFPLVDARAGVVKGLVNVSKSDETSVDSEKRKMLQALADVSAMSMSHWEALEAERGKRLEIKKLFSTLVSPEVVQQLMDNPALAEPRRQKITVVFVDLRGFTNISEAHSPAVVVALLSEFFGKLTPMIKEYGGTLDKYIGDEIMALWGAPASGPADARKAVLACWKMREAFADVQKNWTARLGKPPNIGIAINTGEAMVGLIGSELSRNYTAIGDAVNTAARLEGCTPAGKIYITRSTFEEVQIMIDSEQQPSMRVQGKAEPLEMWEVTSVYPERLSAGLEKASAPANSPSRIVSSRDLARAIHGGGPSADITMVPGAGVHGAADAAAAAADASSASGTVDTTVVPRVARAAARPSAPPPSAEAPVATPLGTPMPTQPTSRPGVTTGATLRQPARPPAGGTVPGAVRKPDPGQGGGA